MQKTTTKQMRSITVLIPKKIVEKIDLPAMEEERSRSKMIELLLRSTLNIEGSSVNERAPRQESKVSF